MWISTLWILHALLFLAMAAISLTGCSGGKKNKAKNKSNKGGEVLASGDGPATPKDTKAGTLDPNHQHLGHIGSNAFSDLNQTDEIQHLLTVEKCATEKINKARTRKNQRLKQAEQEAQNEIEEFRQEKERTFNEYEQQYLGAKKDMEKQINHETEIQLSDMQKSVAQNKQQVIARLLQQVCDVCPELHRNFKLQKKVSESGGGGEGDLLSAIGSGGGSTTTARSRSGRPSTLLDTAKKADTFDSNQTLANDDNNAYGKAKTKGDDGSGVVALQDAAKNADTFDSNYQALANVDNEAFEK